jgi:hypothetical protein
MLRAMGRHVSADARVRVASLQRARSAGGAKQADDLARLRVAPELGFLEYRHAVPRYFEPPAGARHELDVGIGKLRCELGRQPDGPGLVVSERAVLDRDVHGRVVGERGTWVSVGE